jgi:hypothetical protein
MSILFNKVILSSIFQIESHQTFVYETFPSSITTDYLIEPRNFEPMESSIQDIQLKEHTAALARRVRMHRHTNAQKAWTAQVQRQFRKPAHDQVHISEEERNFVFDILIEEVYSKIQSCTYTPEQLQTMEISEIEAACKILYEQQQVLISSADDSELVEKDNVDDLQNTLKSIITKITLYEDVIQQKRQNPSVLVV